MNTEIRESIRLGLIAGAVAASLGAIGMVEAFDERALITDVLTLGQLLLFASAAIGGYLTTKQREYARRAYGLASGAGALVGFFTAVPVVLLILLPTVFPNIRDALVNVSPALIEILTFGQGTAVGIVIMLAVMTLIGALGALFFVLPQRIRYPLIIAITWTLGVGLLSELILNILRGLPREVVRIFFGTKGITPLTAIIVFVAAVAATAWWERNGRKQYRRRRQDLSPEQEKRLRRSSIGAGILVLLLLPFVLGTYLTEVVDNVGLYILMGLGLNIVVGYAGLLDLGYVAFFAIGAYMMGILTSQGDLGMAGISFWIALPIAIATSTLAGVILGVPVLRMRGDYLAIVTLGFGEIIRVLATSDLLKPVIGGAQGVLQIPKPEIFGFTIIQPQHFYYLILLGVLLALYVSNRLRDARLGRRWMALREDEDVAEAMGINLVNTKLLAFGIGAAFSGFAGAIFAARLSSIFPHSFNLLISINVLSLIIVGGIGSLPGVIVGALVLVGLPELLREFAEYRLLIYGALLIAMMVVRPEGLWPSPVRQRELEASEEETMEEESELALEKSR